MSSSSGKNHHQHMYPKSNMAIGNAMMQLPSQQQPVATDGSGYSSAPRRNSAPSMRGSKHESLGQIPHDQPQHPSAGGGYDEERVNSTLLRVQEALTKRKVVPSGGGPNSNTNSPVRGTVDNNNTVYTPASPVRTTANSSGCTGSSTGSSTGSAYTNRMRATVESTKDMMLPFSPDRTASISHHSSTTPMANTNSGSHSKIATDNSSTRQISSFHAPPPPQPLYDYYAVVETSRNNGSVPSSAEKGAKLQQISQGSSFGGQGAGVGHDQGERYSNKGESEMLHGIPSMPKFIDEDEELHERSDENYKNYKTAYSGGHQAGGNTVGAHCDSLNYGGKPAVRPKSQQSTGLTQKRTGNFPGKNQSESSASAPTRPKSGTVGRTSKLSYF